jgi:hypothetical protein
LAARRTELEIEREGQVIEASTGPTLVTSTIEPAAAASAPVTASTEVAPPTPAPAAPDVAIPAAPAGPVESSFIVEREADWRSIMKLTEAEVLSSATVMQLRGEDHAMWLVASTDQTPAGMAMLTSYMENDSYRESFKSTIEDIYAKVATSPEAAQSLEPAMNIAERIVNSVERQLTTAAPAAPSPIETVVDRKLIQGELIEHGPAPYQNKPTNGPSYFVTVKTETGDRTVWGTALEDVMQNEQFKPGDNITLRDHGTVPVVIQVTGPDGVVTSKEAVRREWTTESDTATRTAPGIEASATNGAAPITLTHSSEPITVDPANAADVAKYTRQLTNEVAHQRESIGHASQRIGELENMRDNHSADSGPEFISECNAEIARGKQLIAGSEAIVSKAEAGLQQLGALPTQAPATAESVPKPAIWAASVAKMVAPITLTHSSEPITVDPANAADVAKYTRQLTNEVSVQQETISNATQRIGMLENMRDNQSAGRGPEYIEQCNVEIATAQRQIDGSKGIIERAEVGLQQLASIPAPLDRTEAVTETLTVITEPALVVETVVEEEHGPEMS